jgi:hypothetical protein
LEKHADIYEFEGQQKTAQPWLHQS